MEGLGRAGLEIVGSYPSPFVYIVKDEHSVAICEGLCCKGMHAMAAKACTGRPSGHLVRFSWTRTASNRAGR